MRGLGSVPGHLIGYTATSLSTVKSAQIPTLKRPMFSSCVPIKKPSIPYQTTRASGWPLSSVVSTVEALRQLL